LLGWFFLFFFVFLFCFFPSRVFLNNFFSFMQFGDACVVAAAADVVEAR
jgi:hypothetical protein